MASDFSATLAGLDALKHRIEDASLKITVGAAEIFRHQSAENAPVGEKDNSTNPSGDLRDSMIAEVPVGAGSTWASRVGPTVRTVHPGPGGRVFNYGRQREFGGLLWAKSAVYLAFKTHGVYVRKLFVYQHGAYYLTRARHEGVDAVVALMQKELTTAVRGG